MTALKHYSNQILEVIRGRTAHLLRRVGNLAGFQIDTQVVDQISAKIMDQIEDER